MMQKNKFYTRALRKISACFALITLATHSIAAQQPTSDALNGMHFWGGWSVAGTSAVSAVSGASTGGFSAGAEYWRSLQNIQLGLSVSYLPVWSYNLSGQGVSFSGSAAYLPVLIGARYFFFRGLYAAAGAGVSMGLAGGTTTTGTPFTMSLEAGLEHIFRPRMSFRFFIRNYFFATSPYLNDFLPGVGFVWQF